MRCFTLEVIVSLSLCQKKVSVFLNVNAQVKWLKLRESDEKVLCFWREASTLSWKSGCHIQVMWLSLKLVGGDDVE